MWFAIWSRASPRAAEKLRAGDLLVDSSGSPCKVLHVTARDADEDFVGLNCLDSQVVANGLKASTFGKLHHLPAWWMRIVGTIAGIERASRIGDWIAQKTAGVFH